MSLLRVDCLSPKDALDHLRGETPAVSAPPSRTAARWPRRSPRLRPSPPPPSRSVVSRSGPYSGRASRSRDCGKWLVRWALDVHTLDRHDGSLASNAQDQPRPEAGGCIRKLWATSSSPRTHSSDLCYPFSSFFNSLRKRQSVPWAMSLFGRCRRLLGRPAAGQRPSRPVMSRDGPTDGAPAAGGG